MSISNSITKHDPYAPLRIKDFRLFIFARLFLTIATQMQGVIVGWQIYEHTKDALSLGLIGLAEAVPFILVSLFAGHVADMVRRKRIIMISVSVYFFASSALLLLTLSDSLVLRIYGTAPIFLIIGLTGLARGFAMPSFSALMPQLVPRELYANSSAWNSTVWQTGAVSGPAIGGLIYGFFGVTVAYAVVAGLIVLAIAGVLFIADKPLPDKKGGESLLSSLSEGIRFVFNHEIILSALSLDLFAVLFGGAAAMLPIFAAEVLGVGAQGLGLLRAAPSFGAVLVALILAHQPPMRNAGKNLLVCVAGFGLCMIAFSVSTNIYLSLFLLALSGALDNVSVVIRSTILQLFTPDEKRGRVSAVNGIFIGSSNEIGAFESGAAARLMGLIPSVIFGGTMTILVVAATALRAKQLRKLDLSSV
jgi:MFS family permease